MLRLEPASLVDLLDASYDAIEDRAAWSTRVVEALMSLTSARAGVSFHFTSGYEHEAFQIDTMEGEAALGPVTWNAKVLTAAMTAPSALLEPMLGRTQGTTAASVSGLGVRLGSTPGWRDCWPAPVVDSLGLIARDANGDGFCACVGLHRVSALSARQSRLLSKLATHVGAGARLRRARHARRLDDAEAILAPNGRVLHAHEAAKNKRDALDDGRRRRDEARKTTHDPEKALEIWKGLVAGRWSLVDHFDTDGKQFLLAMKNTPTVDKRADLTPRERRVCALVAMGHPDKEVAYMLGLSTAAVSASLHRARAKLGVSTRAELAVLWRRGIRDG
jgi:DNA-binding CsgD family transcriptional regulator